MYVEQTDAFQAVLAELGTRYLKSSLEYLAKKKHCNNKSIKMFFFLTFAGQSFNILIILRASGLKATSSEA